MTAREELEHQPPLPDIALPVWEAFFALSTHRGSNGFGPNAIGWQDIDAWQRVSGARLTGLELDWIFELDRLFLTDFAEEQKARQPEPGRKR